MTNKVRGGMLLARALEEKGVTQAFTLSGGFCNPALEGLMACGIAVINAPHEQVAGHLADGFTRITRHPAVCLVGPEGFANAIPAMMEAWGERSPVVFITGSSTLKRQGAGGFKEIDDVAIAAPLTKYSAQITDGERIGEFVDRAFAIATGGYPGPVHLSLPVDIMFSSFDDHAGRDERPWQRGFTPPPRAWPEPAVMDGLIAQIAAAERPILIGGHGVWWSGAERQLEQLAIQLNLPVFNIPYHQKLLAEGSAAYMGLADVHQYPPSKVAIDESDLVLMIGARLDNQMNFGNPPLFPRSTKLICVNGSHEELEMNRSADQRVLSDPGALIDSLVEAEAAGRLDSGRFGSWRRRNLDLREEWVAKTLAELPSPASLDGQLHPLHVALQVQSVLEDDDWLVIDGGNTHFWSEIAVNVAGWRGQKLGNILHPGSFSMLGVGVPLAIAAKMENPDSTIMLISGDGAFLSGGLSIEAAFQENLPIVVVIDNNGGLDCISQQQERLFEDGTHFATDFRDIPFHGLFEGLGGHGELVEREEDLVPALQRAIASGKTACVNVRTRGHISPIVLATTSKRDKASIE